MKGKYLFRRIGGVVLAALLLVGVGLTSASNVSAQRRGGGGGHFGGHGGGHGRGRVVIVRPRVGGFGFGGRWGYPYGWGYGYDPWGPYGNYYSQYFFGSSQSAENQGYKDGFKTGRDDGKKDKSSVPERSHYFQDSGFGNYADDYRAGFSHGYQDGYKDGATNRRG
jgi:hypothetical protein